MDKDLINKLKDLLFELTAENTNENLAKLIEFFEGKTVVRKKAHYAMIGLRKDILADYISEKISDDLSSKYISKLEEIEKLFEEAELEEIEDDYIVDKKTRESMTSTNYLNKDKEHRIPEEMVFDLYINGEKKLIGIKDTLCFDFCFESIDLDNPKYSIDIPSNVEEITLKRVKKEAERV